MNNIETMKQWLEALEYKDGNLYWKESRGSVKAGTKAGWLNTSGYLQVTINKKHFLIHRLIWIMHVDSMPETLDHINGDRTDNRIENLRPATISQNNHNRKLQASNKSGIKGVSWHKQMRKWIVSIKLNGRTKNLGYFDDLLLAGQAVKNARQTMHKEFANHG